MGVIIALLMFNCNMDFNQDFCMERHLNCIETVSSYKIGGEWGSLTQDQKLAASYLYCKETNGDTGVRYNVLKSYEPLNHSQSNQTNLWAKPGYWLDLLIHHSSN